jgi:radical SAM protein with 4Fe4S-binding SPASM domain
MMDKLADWMVTLALWGIQQRYPFLRSKTGYDNPRTRHLTGLSYMARVCWMIWPNIGKWLETRATLFPAVLQIQTINRCNARCGMCPYSYTIHLQQRGVMDDAVYSRIVAECAGNADLQEIVPMSKNEPLLDPKLEARVAEFKAVAAPHQVVEIVTNGSALTPTRFARLAESGVDLISISVNAATEETYKKVKRGPSWAQVTKNLEALAAADTSQVNIFVRYIKQSDNLDEFKSFAAHWRQRDFNILAYEINNRSGTVRDYTRMLPTRGLFQRHLRRAVGRRFRGLCPYVFSIAHVLHNGDVPLCANDWHNRKVLGNVRHSTLGEIFNSPRIQQIREWMYQGRYAEITPCRDCSYQKDWLNPDHG